MMSIHDSHETRAVKITGKEIVKTISLLGYNQCVGGTDLNDKLLRSYLLKGK